MLYDPCPRCFPVCIIHCGISLKIRYIQHFRLKPDTPVFQCSQFIVEISVNRPGINYLLRQTIQFRFIFQIIRLQTDFNAIQHIRDHLRVTADRDPLIKRIEIIIVKGQAYRKSFDDESRQFRAEPSPLLFRVPFDQLFINIRSHQRNSLFLQIFRFRNTGCFPLFLNFCSRFFRCHHPPHFIKGVHIKRQGI